MADDPVERPHRLLDALQARLDQDPRLRAEQQRARREFFGPGQPWFHGDAQAGAAAEQRCREWFLLERDSEVLGAPPLEVVGREEELDLLGESIAGAFSIERVRGGEADARDLQTGQLHEVRLMGLRLVKGDMVVGRLFPSAGGALLLSQAAAVFRPGAALAEAFRRDLARAGLDRRLSQQELEQLLVVRSAQAAALAAGAGAGRPLEHLEAELERLFVEAGCNWSVAEVSRELAASPGPGASIGPMLDRLAFETKVDLDRVRRCLLAIWSAQHAGGETEAPAGEGETLGQRLVRTLDEGLAKHQDVEELFRQLETMAGIEGDDDQDDDEGSLPGDLEPLVQEYLWEGGEAVARDAATLQLWVQLQNNAAVPRTDLEQVTGLDLMRVLLQVYLAARPDSRSSDAHAAFAVLQRFYDWAEATQGYHLRTALAECRGGLLDHLERLQAIGERLSGARSSAPEAPCLMHVDEVGPSGFGVRLDGGEAVWIPARGPVTDLLRSGDLLLGNLERRAAGGTLTGLVVALPPEAASLVG